MENAKKPNAFLVVFLLLTVVLLVAMDIYQDRLIQQQRYELHWLLTHSTIRPEAFPSDAKAPQALPKPQGTQSSAANVAPTPAPAPAKPAPQPPATAKP